MWKITPNGVVTSYGFGADALGICSGPDGNLWIADNNGYVWKVTPSGVATSYSFPLDTAPTAICAGPDGDLWVTDPENSAVWQVTTSGVATSYYLPGANPVGICTGPDGNLWIADQNGAVWKVTTSGVATSYSLPGSSPTGICAGPDGNLWVADQNAAVWKITTSGVATSYSLSDASPQGICTGPDGNLWVADANSAVSQITTSGVATSFSLSGGDPAGICTGPDGNLWVADNNREVRKVILANDSVSLSSPINPSSLDTPATFNATVTGTPSGTPTGTVSFYDGTTLLGTAALVDGTASLTTSGLLNVGTNSISAAYSGNSNFTPVTSATLLDQTVSASAIILTPPVGAPMTCAGVPLVFSRSGGNGISLTDLNPGNTPLTVTLSVSDGTLTLASTANLTFTEGTGADNESVTFTGTAANVSAALNGLTYTPDANFSGSDELNISVNDSVAQADGDSPITATVPLVVGLPNVAVAGQQLASRGVPLILSASGGGSGITVGDAAPDDTQLTVTLSVAQGTLSLDSAAGLTFLAGTAFNSSSMTFTGTAPDINAALGLLSYTSQPLDAGNDLLTISVDDSATLAAGVDTASASIPIVVEAPSVTPPTEDQTTYANAPLAFSAAAGNAVTVGDSASGSTPLTVTLSVVNGTLALGQTTNLTFTTGTGTGGDATMTFTGVTADINAALDGLTYTPDSGYFGADQLSISVDDPGTLAAGSGTAFATVGIAVNAPPAINVPDGQATQTDTGLTFSAQGGNAITLTYPTLNNAPVTVSLSVSDGTLSLADDWNLTFSQGTGTNDSAMTFTGTVGDINTALDGLTYQPADGFDGGDTLQISVYDPAVAGSSQAPIAASVPIALQTLPSANVPSDQFSAGGSTVVFSAADGNALTVGDTGSSSTIMTVTLSVGDGDLTLAQTTGLTFLSGTGTNDASMTFTGVATDINNDLDGLVYTPNSGYSGVDALNISADDPQSSANGLTDFESVNIAVASSASGPSVSVPDTQETDNQTPVVLSLDEGDGAIMVADSGPSSTILTVTLSVADGTLSLAQTSNLTFSSGSNGGASMTFTGTAANINAALDGLTYTPDSGFMGNDAISISVNDPTTLASGHGTATGSVDTLAVRQVISTQLF